MYFFQIFIYKNIKKTFYFLYKENILNKIKFFKNYNIQYPIRKPIKNSLTI